MKTLVMPLALAALSSACADGYPPKEAGLNLHFQMTEADALAALNRIGAQEHLAENFQYDLKDGCLLEVTILTGKLKKQINLFALREAEPRMIKSGTEDSYMTAMQTAGAEPTSAKVLADGTWSDATMVKWLLEYLPKFCV